MSSTPQRIAVIKPCCIGDCVMALPALDVLTGLTFGGELDVLVGAHSAPIFAGLSGVSTVREIPDIPSGHDLPALIGLLRRGRYNRIVLLDRSRWLRLAARLAGATRVQWVRNQHPQLGYRHESDLYLEALLPKGTFVIAGPPQLHIADADRAVAGALLDEIASAFACDEAGRTQRVPLASPLPDSEGVRRGEAMPRPSSFPRFAVIHPGGAVNPGALMLQKRWPAERFVVLAGALRARGLEVLLTGGPDEVQLAARISEQAELPAAANVAGRLSLLQTAALIERAALYVGGDTGVSHLAAACGTPSVVIFGPTNPLRYGPRGPKVTIVAPAASYAIADVDLRRAPDDARAVATSQVSLAEVLTACVDLLFPAEAA